MTYVFPIRVGLSIVGTILFFISILGVRAETSTLPDPSKSIVQVQVWSLNVDFLAEPVQRGSGVFVELPTNSGKRPFIITNAHVVTLPKDIRETRVESEPIIFVCSPRVGERIPRCHTAAAIVSIDHDQDLALLALFNPLNGVSLGMDSGISAIDLTSGTQPTVGDTIRFFGYPSTGAESLTLTQGIVSGFLDRGATSLIKSDAQLNPGNSGGGAFDAVGNFIGLANAIVKGPGGALGLAIPADRVAQWTASLGSIDLDSVRIGALPRGITIAFQDAESLFPEIGFSATQYALHSLGTDGSSVDAMLARADGWTIHEIQEAGITLKKETANGSVIGVVSAKIIPTPYMLSIRDTEALIPRTIEASGGESSKAIIEQRLMRYSDDQRPYMYASFTVKGIPVSSVILPIGKRIVVITGMNLEDRPQIETDIQQMVEPIAVSFDGHESPDVHEFTNAWAMTSDARRAWPDYPIVEFSVPNDWVVEAQNSLQEPVLVFWKARFGRPISLSIDKIHERLAPLPTATLLQRAIDEVRAAAEKGDPQFMYQMQGIRTIGTVDMYELVRDAQIPGGARAGKIEYVVRRGAYLISFSFDADSFADALAVAPQYRAALSTLSISGTPELPDPALSRLDKQQQSIQSGGEDSMIAPQPQLSKMMQTHHGLLEASGAVVAYNTRRLKNQKEEQSLKAELKKKLTERLAIVGKKPAWNAKQWEKFYRQYIYGYYWVEDIFRSLVVSKIIHPTKRAPEWRQESGYQKEFAKISWIQMLDARIPGTKQIKGNDRDGDGLPDLFEKNIGTDPKKKDTDGDGYSDGEEVRAGHNPLQPAAKKKPVVKKKSAVEKTPAKKKK